MLKKTEDGADTVTRTSEPLTFLIEGRPPRLTVSMGLAFSTAATPKVVISKTSNVVSFEKDGKTQQAYEQGSRGLNLTAGVMFSLEDEIDPSVGFEAGQRIDPTLGLTVADIQTKSVWHRRVALGVTMDF